MCPACIAGAALDRHRRRLGRWLERSHPAQAAVRERFQGRFQFQYSGAKAKSKGGMIVSSTQVEHPHVVSQSEWLAARQELLAREKSFTRERDALSAARRKLPWVRVEKEYVFDAPGKETLADLFAGRSQLFVYHFMLGPGWKEGCPGCSFVSDHFDGSVVHLEQRATPARTIFLSPKIATSSSCPPSVAK